MHPAVYRFSQLPMQQAEAIVTASFAKASDTAKRTAQARYCLVSEITRKGGKIDVALSQLQQELENGAVSPLVKTALQQLKKLPSRSTLFNWMTQYKTLGMDGLVPGHQGKARKDYGWEAKCLELFHSPNKPSLEMVADHLQRLGFKSATASRLRSFINAMPHELGADSIYRVGAKLYRERHKDHRIRHTDTIPAGFLYNADGHTLDVYLAHPNTGKPWRAELTAFMDVRSRVIVGWEISESESAISTLTALSRAMATHDHVPAMLYLDNGSGYKSAMMNDDTAGFYAQFNIEPIFAIPGNARAKWIERFFLTLEDRLGKTFTSYCGRDHDERHKAEVLRRVKAGEIELPSLDEWIAAFKDFLDWYHHEPHPEVAGKTRWDVWQELERVPVGMADYQIRPRAKVNVLRGRVRLHKRDYAADYLHQFNGQELLAEYDLHDDSQVALLQLDGSFLMLAQLKTKVAALPSSRIEEATQNRLVGQEKRLQRKVLEVRHRAALTSTIDLQQLTELSADLPALDNVIPLQLPVQQENSPLMADLVQFQSSPSENLLSQLLEQV
jgi:putative transposase